MNNSTKAIVTVSRANPCPHCHKGDWCYSIGALSVCNRGNEPARGWKQTGKFDKEGKEYYAPDKQESEKKPIREKKTTYYEYPARDGSNLVRVVRIDDGTGKKNIYQQRWGGSDWVNGTEGIDRADIPIYNHPAVKQAIANGEPVIIVEGESCVDALTAIGITATTNIGGAGKWRSSDSDCLAGATTIIIAPDRDKPGIEHGDMIEADLVAKGIAIKWLYVYPDQPIFWGKGLPVSGGFDIKDYIDDYKPDNAAILALVGDKKDSPTGGGKGNVIDFPRSKSHISLESLTEKIEELVKGNYTGYKLKSHISGLAATTGRTLYDIEQLYKARLDEIEQEESRSDHKSGLESIQAAENFRLDISEILPAATAKQLKAFGDYLSLRPEVLATALITGTSSIHHPETKYDLIPESGYSIPPNLYAAIVADSSQKKSPIIKEMVYKPLLALQKRAREQYEHSLRQFNEELRHYEALKKGKNTAELLERFPGGEPQPPAKPLFYTTDATFEGIARLFNDQKDHGLLYYVDELAGLFKSLNAYRGGKGRDEENLLSLYDGGGQAVLRKSGDFIEADSTLLSILGTIQPEVLKGLMGDGRDSNGKWARFIFCHQPNQAATISGRGGAVILDLETLYQAIAEKPQAIYEHSDEARRIFEREYDAAENKRVSEMNPALQHLYGKLPGLIGKLALNLHLIHHAYSETVPIRIGGETMAAAVKFAMFYVNQAKFFMMKMDDSIDNVPAHQAKILDLAERKGDWLTWRDIQVTCSGKKREEAKANYVEWFRQLADMGRGEIIVRGATAKFKIHDVGNVGNVGKNVGKNVGIPTRLESLPGETSNKNVGNVGKKNNFSLDLIPPLVDEEKINTYRDAPTLPTLPTLPTETQSVQGIEDVGKNVGDNLHEPTLPTFSGGDENVGDDLHQPTKPTFCGGDVTNTEAIEDLGEYTGDDFDFGDDLEKGFIDKVTGKEFGFIGADTNKGFGIYWDIEKNRRVRRGMVNLVSLRDYYTYPFNGKIIEAESNQGCYCVESNGERSYVPRGLWRLHHRQKQVDGGGNEKGG